MNIIELQRAVDANDDEAMVQLGDLYHEGNGVPQDDAKATELYEKAADLGNSNACYRFGMQNYNGWGVPVNKPLAIYYWMKGAKLDHWGCQLLIGNSYQTGDCVPKDMEKALYWLNKSADKGLADAHYELGKIYLSGQESVEPDEAKAIEHLTIATQSDENCAVEAMNCLGDYYRQKKTAENLDEALKWYDMAADKGNFYASHYAVIISAIVANAAMSVVRISHGWDWALTDLNKHKECIEREEKIINSGNYKIGQNLIDEVQSYKVKNNFNLATCFFMLDRYAETCKILGRNGDIESRMMFTASVLLGDVQSEKGKGNIYNLVRELETMEYDPNKSKGLATDLTYAMCIEYLANIHRLQGGKELETAVMLLDHAISIMKESTFREALIKERNRYQKRFGGYKYV